MPDAQWHGVEMARRARLCIEWLLDRGFHLSRNMFALSSIHVTAVLCFQTAKTYRLDIELGRLEFLVHPAMAREDLLVGTWHAGEWKGTRMHK